MKANNLKILKQIRAEQNPKSKYNDILDKMIAEEEKFNKELLTSLKDYYRSLKKDDLVNKTIVMEIMINLTKTETPNLNDFFTKEQSLAIINVIKDVIRKEENRKILDEIRNLEF